MKISIGETTEAYAIRQCLTTICSSRADGPHRRLTQDEDVAYAIACVTVLGTFAMFLLPMTGAMLGFDAHAFGIWSGASIHEVAQVAAVSFQHSEIAGEIGTVTKLFRVTLLAPLIMVLAFSIRFRAPKDGARLPTPWFVFGFAGLVLINSFFTVPQDLLTIARIATTVLLSSALAVMGLTTRIGALLARGTRPALLAAGSAVFIATVAALLTDLLVA